MQCARLGSDKCQFLRIDFTQLGVALPTFSTRSLRSTDSVTVSGVCMCVQCVSSVCMCVWCVHVSPVCVCVCMYVRCGYLCVAHIAECGDWTDLTVTIVEMSVSTLYKK